ncbi:MAG: HD domain-containing protein [Deltaproteobacteria bacterium]|nr:HD domain-containing protein [Deltaproteobacteria bacterium]
MNPEESVKRLKSWFEAYVDQFASNDPRVQENMDMKRWHTRRVCAAILDIGDSLKLSREDLCTAEITGWLHDIGRFEQYTRYGTFADHRSEDHAALGVKVMHDTRILEKIGAVDNEIIIRVVGAHNRAALPDQEDDRVLFFLKLLRDADKIDVLGVVTGYYQKAGHERNHTLELDLPDRPHVSDPVYEALMNGRLVRMADLKTINDFKLLQMAWIYDINFPRTFEMVREKGYLEILRDALTHSSNRTAQVYRRARAHLDRHCSGDKAAHGT